jgi:hypothetical protein
VVDDLGLLKSFWISKLSEKCLPWLATRRDRSPQSWWSCAPWRDGPTWWPESIACPHLDLRDVLHGLDHVRHLSKGISWSLEFLQLTATRATTASGSSWWGTSGCWGSSESASKTTAISHYFP